MIYGSVCSGIEAATVAWHPLGWKPAFFSEIDKFPSKLLKKRYLKVPNAGDFTLIQEGQYEPIDLLVGGTPCQPFSVAGLRRGLADDRGNLTLEFLRLAERLRPKWLVWENVPGVYSATSYVITDRDNLRIDGDGGRLSQRVEADEAHAFSCFVAGLQELGYGFAYRTLDAQHFGVPQRRRRVFVVGYLGDWRRAAAVLFERHSLSGHPPPRREKREVAPTIPSRRTGGGGLGSDFDFDGGLVAGTMSSASSRSRGSGTDTATIVSTLDASYARLQGQSGQDANHGHSHLIAYGGNNTSGPIEVATAVNACSSPSGRMDFESETFIMQAGTTRENPESGPDGVGVRTDGIAYTLEARPEVQAVAFRTAGDGCVYKEGDQTAPITTGTDSSANIVCFDTTQITSKENRCNPQPGDPSHPLASGAHPPALLSHLSSDSSDRQVGIRTGMAVRRLTPRECERLQGFPDDYTKLSDKTADGPRYKALGNSMAVPVMRWIGERIQMVEDLHG